MKKRLVVMVIVLSAFCFTGFAQETFNFESQQYFAAKKDVENEYTIVVQAEIWDKNGTDFEVKNEIFTIIAEDRKIAEKEAVNRFKKLYSRGSNNYTGHIKRIVIKCTSIKNACQI